MLFIDKALYFKKRIYVMPFVTETILTMLKIIIIIKENMYLYVFVIGY